MYSTVLLNAYSAYLGASPERAVKIEEVRVIARGCTVRIMSVVYAVARYTVWADVASTPCEPSANPTIRHCVRQYVRYVSVNARGFTVQWRSLFLASGDMCLC